MKRTHQLFILSIIGLNLTACGKFIDGLTDDSSSQISSSSSDSSSSGEGSLLEGLVCKVYDLSPTFQEMGCPVPSNDPNGDPLALPAVPLSVLFACGMQLPDLDLINPVDVIILPNFSVAPRSWTQGFPGFPENLAYLKEWYGISCSGVFRAKSTGAYGFLLHSDDGAKMWLDNNLIVENDFVHAPVTIQGNANLTAGDHAFRLDWFQGPRHLIALELLWRRPYCVGPDCYEGIIPSTQFFHNIPN